MNVAGKSIEVENIIECEVSQIQKDIHGLYSLKFHIIQKKYWILWMQPTGLKKFNNPKGPEYSWNNFYFSFGLWTLLWMKKSS